MQKIQTDVPRFFIVTHKFNGKRWRAERESKNKLKKDLPRYSEGAGYMSYFDIEEVSFSKFRKMKHLPDVCAATA